MEIPVNDRVNLRQVKEKLERVYEDVLTLDEESVRLLCAFLITVHNHWNWDQLLVELKNHQQGGNNGSRS